MITKIERSKTAKKFLINLSVFASKISSFHTRKYVITSILDTNKIYELYESIISSAVDASKMKGLLSQNSQPLICAGMLMITLKIQRNCNKLLSKEDIYKSRPAASLLYVRIW